MSKDFSKWFNCLDIYTRLLACTTVLISLFVSSIIYFITYSLHENLVINQVEVLNLTTEIVILYMYSTFNCIVSNDLFMILEKVYLTIQDIYYLVLVESSGQVIAAWPSNYFNTYTSLDCLQHIEMSRNIASNIHICLPYDQLWQPPDFIDIFISMLYPRSTWVYLHIGIKDDIGSLASISLVYTYLFTLFIFIVIWFASGSTILINFLMIRNAIQNIRLAISKICSGDFRISLSANSLGSLTELVSDFNDMAHRLEIYEKNNVQQLVLEKSKLELLLSIIADGLVLLDKEFKIVFINPAAKKNWKFLKACIIGNYFYEYLPGDLRGQIMPLLNELIKVNIKCNSFSNDMGYAKSLKVYLHNDTSNIFQLIMIPVMDTENQLLNCIGISIQDITNQIGLNEAKTQFISNVSHELRTPLFNIRSFLETLSEYNHTLSNKQKMEFLDIANQETHRLTNLVNDVLDLSRLESGFVDMLEPVEFHDIVPPIIQTSQLRARNKKVQLCFQICPNVTSVNGYPNLMTQVLSNLIGNSLKFTGVDGRILLKVYLTPKSSYMINEHEYKLKLRVEIIDEGTGIDELDQNRIFDRFVRLENNVHTLEGTGLGLSIVKNIVDKHRSHVNIYSESCIGSSFWFDLSILEKKS
uniref:Uncharacterized sensor-like histidine kinase ycf26 n=1 Tax=Hommersandiophycus borowitzkae TaxID=268573 RepID=A0A1G4NTU2_9FLOR|nr:Drug sensory protein A [Hommersandiophycus borowitzkae]SCW22102.1 Drug sensory protein A [Hommersandiophycus borowitzkae]